MQRIAPSGAGVVVVGAGIVGLASAYALLTRWPHLRLTVLEKEAEVGRHQTSHNSGVLHAGLYYAPGSAKARLAVAGIREMVRFCREHGIPHEICGKLVVATDDAELARLHALHERGMGNGLAGLRLLGAGEMREIEPHVGGIAALHVPGEGIVDYPAVARRLAELITSAGGRILTNARVLRIRREGRGWVAESTAGAVEADYLVGCAGLHADRVARMTAASVPLRIVPFRGQYYRLRTDREHLVRHLIYPVPDPAFPFLGVHFTRLIGGGVEAGPNAVLALAREGYTSRDVSFRDAAEIASFPGTIRFVGRHPRESAAELVRSFSPARFARSLQRLVPEVRASDLAPGGAGVRAQAMRPDGSLVEDFAFSEAVGALHVLNAPSPAATASLAIGGEVATRVAAAMRLESPQSTTTT
jgi:(S)-2-hydroxyglutarate dehydrogenase